MAKYNFPDHYYANKSAIRPSTFKRNDFKLKHVYFNLLGKQPYHGLPQEHPIDYLERIEDLVYAIKANGVCEDYLLYKLFKYSFSGDASYWLKQLSPESLTSWTAIKNAFLHNFFDDARSEDLRKKISMFSHGSAESFKDPWTSFRSYQRDCLHHEFNEVQLLSTFFRGLALVYQMALNTVGEGNFNTRNPEEAVKLIEKLASNKSTKNTDYERKKSADSLDKGQVAEVKAKLDSVQRLLKKQFNFAEGVEVFEVASEDE